jgi:hypothetical protein
MIPLHVKLLPAFAFILLASGCLGGHTVGVSATKPPAVSPDSPQQFKILFSFDSGSSDTAGATMTVTAEPDGSDITIDPANAEVTLNSRGEATVVFRIAVARERTVGPRQIQVVGKVAWNMQATWMTDFEVQ